ncbi:unnamed protein product, partial [Mesorhabditis spiculigera]
MSSDVIKRADPSDDYALLQRVGAGTYGEVYKARHIRNGDFSAVKVVKLEAGDNFSVIQQEIMMIRDCIHPNIIAYYGSYLRRDRLWIVMEYCGGGSLQDIYQMTGPLSELQIAFVCRETLKGLDYLHKMGKVHRDIKGANVLLTQHGDVKLADFGVAAQITATIGKRKSFIGTPYWMAPEVASVEKRGGYGVQCDVWAMGITAIELAECQPPFYDLHPMQVLYLMTKSTYKSPSLKESCKWSSQFHDFIKQCLTKNPKKRPLPEKLLASHPLLSGYLSSRMTRDLLDRVNNTSSGFNANYSEVRLCESEEIDDDDDLQRSGPSPSFRLADILEGQRIGGRPKFRPPDPPNISDGSLSDRDYLPMPDVLGGGPLLQDKVNSFQDHRDLRTIKVKPAYANGPMLGRASSTEERNVSFRSDASEKPRPVTLFGLPLTPKVYMGACFSQLLHNVSLDVHCGASWINPTTNGEFLLIGAEEGIFAMDLGNLHDARLVQLDHRRCLWMHIHKDIMMAMQGKTTYLYRHDLLALTAKKFAVKLSKSFRKMPIKLFEKSLSSGVRLPETKDCLQCCVQPGIGLRSSHLYLAVTLPSSVWLYQWYDPQNKFLSVRSCQVWPGRMHLHPFQLLNTRSDFPQVCIGVKRCGLENFTFDYVSFGDNSKMIDPETTLEVGDIDGRLEVVDMAQLERDRVIFAFSSYVVVTDLNGVSRPAFPNGPSLFKFDFVIKKLVVLSDSFLVFHAHGVEGRSLSEQETTQHLHDTSRDADPEKPAQRINDEALEQRGFRAVRNSRSRGL